MNLRASGQGTMAINGDRSERTRQNESEAGDMWDARIERLRNGGPLIEAL